MPGNINRFYRRTPYEGNLYSPPIDMLGKVLAAAQQKYDTNLAASEELRNKYIDSLPIDRAVADQLQSEYDKRIDETVAKHKGDFSQMTGDLYRLKRDIDKDFNQGGKAWAIATRKKQLTDWYENQRKNKDILESDLNEAYNYYVSNDTGVGDKNPTTGSYNMFDNLKEIAPWVDPSKLTDEVYKTHHSDKRSVTKNTFRNGFIYEDKSTEEYMDPSKLYQGFTSAFASDPKLMEYLRWKSSITGKPMNEMLQQLDSYAQNRAQELAWTHTDQDQKVSANPFALEDAKQRNRIDLAKKKGEIWDPGEGLPLEYMGQQINGAGTKLDATDWRKNILSPSNNFGNVPISGIPLGFGASTHTMNPPVVNPSTSLLDFAYGAKGKEKGIDTYNLENAGKELYQNSGGDMRTWETHRQKFFKDNENAIVRRYNELTDQTQQRSAFAIPVPPNAQRMMTENAVSRIFMNSPITIIDERGNAKTTTYNEASKSGLISPADLKDDKGNLLVQATHYNAVGGLNAPPGTMIGIPGSAGSKTIVVHDLDIMRNNRFREAQESIQAAYNGSAVARPFEAGMVPTRDDADYGVKAGQPIRIAPIRPYPNGNDNWAENQGLLFHMVDNSGNTTGVLTKGMVYGLPARDSQGNLNPLAMQPANIVDLNSTVFASAYQSITPMGGASSANAGRFPLSEEPKKRK